MSDPASLRRTVREILDAVRAEGDPAFSRFVERFEAPSSSRPTLPLSS
jgi:histidinol dehydrogenase